MAGRHSSSLQRLLKGLSLLLIMLVFPSSPAEGIDLPPPERSYKILMLLPASSKSHRNVFMPVAEALGDRGHQVVMVHALPKKTKHPNVIEVDHGLPYFNSDNMNMFELRNDPEGGFSMFKETLPRLAREFYTVPAVKELYDRRKEFDLIVINHMFNELAYPFAHEMPFITIATPGFEPRHSAVLGNVANPAYVENIKGGCKSTGTMKRLCELIFHIVIPYYWRNLAIVPLIQKEITPQFPELPSLLEMESNQSLTLMNSHFSMSTAIPLLPSQVEVGGMHCRPAKPLPENIKSWIEGAGPAGVIYFSLGSITKGENMPAKYRDIFIETFKKMDQRILWKFESEMANVPPNVMISKWLPQQDILAHPNVKVFITHGGLLSMQESCYHGTPMLTIPVCCDQEKTGANVESLGLGKRLTWEELTEDLVKDNLLDLIHNPKYKEKLLIVEKSFKDQLETPVDRAVFWTEYVIRHQGAPALVSPEKSLTWVEFLLLDALLVIFIILVVLLLTLRWIIKKILSKIFGTSKKI